MKNYVSNAQRINKSSCIWTEKPRTSDFFLSHRIVRSYDENWDLSKVHNTNRQLFLYLLKFMMLTIRPQAKF